MIRYLDDAHPLSSWLVHRNLARQYDFMNTAFVLWGTQGRPHINLNFVNDLNFYAAHHLSPHPGVPRSTVGLNVQINGADHTPPAFEKVDGWLAEFFKTFNYMVRLRRGPSDFGYDPMISPTLCLISFTALKSKFSLRPMAFAVGNGRMRTSSGSSRKVLSVTGK